MRKHLTEEIELDLNILKRTGLATTRVEGISQRRFDRVLGLNRDRSRGFIGASRSHKRPLVPSCQLGPARAHKLALVATEHILRILIARPMHEVQSLRRHPGRPARFRRGLPAPPAGFSPSVRTPTTISAGSSRATSLGYDIVPSAMAGHPPAGGRRRSD